MGDVRLTKKNCGDSVDGSISRNHQIKMLDMIARLCDENGLHYYLSGGTLLGAVRHKGFIPWDDDIDINMPRGDVEKLEEIIKKNPSLFEGYEISKGGSDVYSPACQWYRLYDQSVIIENFFGGASDKPFYHPLFIDIFPIDGFPKNDAKTKIFCWELIFIRKMLGVSWHKEVIAKSALYYVAHLIAYIPSKLVGFKNWRNLFQREAKRFPFEDSEYVGVTTTVQYLPREKVKKEDYIKPVEVIFEGKKYRAPQNYDTYLSQLYGDYMRIPPEEKRKSDHSFKMYWNISSDGGGQKKE